jgi:ubiquinone biosynthesis protein UbiJ
VSANSGDAILAPLQALLNRSIDASGEARELLRRLDGHTLALGVRGTGLNIYLVSRGGALQLSLSSSHDPEAAIVGTPLGLASLGLGDPRSAFRDGSVRATGDAVLAGDFRKLLVAARPDWEEELSQIVGDVAAHQIGNLVRGLGVWTQKTGDTVARNFGEFLTEESRDVPSDWEVQKFCTDVDTLNDDVERLIARIDRIEAPLRGSDR